MATETPFAFETEMRESQRYFRRNNPDGSMSCWFHDSCIIALSATIHETVKTSRFLTIMHYVSIGEKCDLRKSGITIGAGTEIGSRVKLGGHSKIGHSVTIDSYSKISGWVEVDNKVTIGQRSKIRASTKIGEHCRIGSDVLIGWHTEICSRALIADNTVIPNNICLDKREAKAIHGVTFPA